MASSPGGVEVSRVTVRAVPDTSRFFDELKADLAEIEARVMLDVKASVDAAALTASAKEAVAEAQAATGDINVKAKVDTSQLSEASSLFSRLGGSVSGVGLAIGALGPALIPIAAALAGIATALAAPLAIAAGGATLFAFLTGAAIKQTEEQKKKIDQLKAAVDSAKQSLSNTSASAATSAKNSLATAQSSAQASIKSAQQAAAAATTAAGQVSAANRIEAAHAALSARRNAIAASQSASVASAQRKYNEALLKYHAALNGLTPAQEKFLEAQQGLKDAFHQLIVDVGPALLGPVTRGLKLLASVLPDLTPVIRTASAVFTDLVKQMSDAAGSPAFKRFISAFAKELGPDLRAFARIAKNIFVGLFGLFSAFNTQLSGSVLKGLENITKGFADFGRSAQSNAGLKAFVKYVKDTMPAVGRLIAGTFSLITAALAGLAPLGKAALDGINGIVSAFQKLGALAPPLAGALALFGVGSFFGGPEVGAAAAAVLGLVTGFKQLYENSKPLQKILRDIGDYFVRTWLPKIQSAAQDVLPAFKSAFKDITDTLRENRGFFTVVGEALTAFGSAAVIGAIELLAESVRQIASSFKVATAAVKFFANVTLTSFEVIVAGVKALVGAILGQFGDIVDAQAAAFGWVPKIGAKIKAAQANFHEFADGVTGNLDGVSQNLKDLQDKINEVGKSHPQFHIDSNTLDLIDQMHKLDAFRFKDKSIKITAQFEEQIDRTRGPGGGIGHPGDVGSNSNPKIQSGNGGAGIHIDKATFSDARDARRQASKWLRGRAGGGANFNISPAMGG